MRAVRWVVAAVAVVASATMASSHEATSKGVTVAHPWARATPGGATVGAAFMEIRTDKGVTDRLISVASPVAGRAEVHTHIMDGNAMLSVRGDMAEECWRIVEPVVQAWRDGDVPLESYAAGTQGPKRWESSTTHPEAGR